MNAPKLLKRHGPGLASLTWVLLAVACGNNPPAPVTEAGQELEIIPPLIVDGDTPTGQPGTSRSQPTVVATGSATATADTGLPATHIVRRGETLFSIAYQYELDFRQLAIANDLNPPYTIFVDQELNLDLSRVVSNRPTSNTDLGRPVSNNDVARSRAGVGRSGGVIRQPIETVQTEPRWQWPHRGEIRRRFAATGNVGLDIGGRLGDPVLAAAAGDVVYAGRGVQGVGNLIILRHNDRYLSAYGHNRTLLVSEGSHVQAGQQIAEVGENAAGVATLHFEIRFEGKAVDPGNLLPDR